MSIGREPSPEEARAEAATSRRQVYALVGLFMVSVLVIGVVLAILSTGVGSGGGTWWQKIAITHKPVTTGSLGQDIDITATVTGFPQNVTLYYLVLPNNSTYATLHTLTPKTVYMLLISPGGYQYSYTIQGTEVLGDITYHIAASDAYGNMAVTGQTKIKIDDFVIETEAKEMSVYVATPATTTVTVRSINGFSSAVSLRATQLGGQTALPGGLAADFSPASVTPPKGGAATSKLTIRSTSTQFVPSGIFYFKVEGIAGTQRGTVVRNGTVTTLKVPDFDFTVSPSSQSVTRQVVAQVFEKITPFNLTITIQQGFESDLAFRTIGLPTTGVGYRWVIAGANFKTTGTTTVTLQIITTPSATVGSYTLTIYVTGGGLEKWKQVSFVVMEATQSPVG